MHNIFISKNIPRWFLGIEFTIIRYTVQHQKVSITPLILCVSRNEAALQCPIQNFLFFSPMFTDATFQPLIEAIFKLILWNILSYNALYFLLFVAVPFSYLVSLTFIQAIFQRSSQVFLVDVRAAQKKRLLHYYKYCLTTSGKMDCCANRLSVRDEMAKLLARKGLENLCFHLHTVRDNAYHRCKTALWEKRGLRFKMWTSL